MQKEFRLPPPDLITKDGIIIDNKTSTRSLGCVTFGRSNDKTIIDLSEYTDEYALFIYDNKPKIIKFTEAEILEFRGEVEYYEDSGFGQHERHTGGTRPATWDDIDRELIIKFILENPKHWEDETE